MPFALQAYPYATIEMLLIDLNKVADDRALRPNAALLLQDAALMLNDHCGRVFLPLPATETRIFDAPPSSLLMLPDLLDTPDPVITLGGVTLGPSEYDLLPFVLTNACPHYEQVRFFATGIYAPWNGPALIAGRTPRGDVSILGAWAYAPTVPGPIVRATLRIAARLWHQRKQQYSDGPGGNSNTGETPTPGDIIDGNIEQLLAPYKRVCAVGGWH